MAKRTPIEIAVENKIIDDFEDIFDDLDQIASTYDVDLDEEEPRKGFVALVIRFGGYELSDFYQEHLNEE